MTPNEPRELKDEGYAILSDLLDLVFGAGMIIASVAVIIMMICAKAGRNACFAGIVLFLFCLMVGGKMMRDAWKNLKKRT